MLRGILVAAGMVALAAGLVPTFGTEPAIAEVRSNIRYSGYPVRGLTAQEIWRDIGRKGPRTKPSTASMRRQRPKSVTLGSGIR